MNGFKLFVENSDVVHEFLHRQHLAGKNYMTIEQITAAMKKSGIPITPTEVSYALGDLQQNRKIAVDDASSTFMPLVDPMPAPPGRFQPFQTLRQAKDWAHSNSFIEYRDQLTVEELAALKDYTGPGYFVNLHLRNNDQQDRISGSVALLDSAIDKGVINRDVVLFRGVRSPRIPHLQPGDTWHDAGFSSTSLSKMFADKFVAATDDSALFEMHIPAGTHGAFIDKIKKKQEYEILLPRGLSFDVISVDSTRIVL